MLKKKKKPKQTSTVSHYQIKLVLQLWQMKFLKEIRVFKTEYSAVLSADEKSDSTVYVLSVALVFTTTLLVVLAYSVLRIYKRQKCHCKGKAAIPFLFWTISCFDWPINDCIAFILKQDHKLSPYLISHLKLWVLLTVCSVKLWFY